MCQLLYYPNIALALIYEWLFFKVIARKPPQNKIYGISINQNPVSDTMRGPQNPLSGEAMLQM